MVNDQNHVVAAVDGRQLNSLIDILGILGDSQVRNGTSIVRSIYRGKAFAETATGPSE